MLLAFQASKNVRGRRRHPFCREFFSGKREIGARNRHHNPSRRFCGVLLFCRIMQANGQRQAIVVRHIIPALHPALRR